MLDRGPRSPLQGSLAHGYYLSPLSRLVCRCRKSVQVAVLFVAMGSLAHGFYLSPLSWLVCLCRKSVQDAVLFVAMDSLAHGFYLNESWCCSWLFYVFSGWILMYFRGSNAARLRRKRMAAFYVLLRMYIHGWQKASLWAIKTHNLFFRL